MILKHRSSTAFPSLRGLTGQEEAILRTLFRDLDRTFKNIYDDLSKMGSGYFPITSVSSAYTAADDDFTILVDASGGSVTVTLPDTAGRDGKIYNIKKVDSSANTVVVSGTIDGSASYTLINPNESISVHASELEAAWFII